MTVLTIAPQTPHRHGRARSAVSPGAMSPGAMFPKAVLTAAVLAASAPAAAEPTTSGEAQKSRRSQGAWEGNAPLPAGWEDSRDDHEEPPPSEDDAPDDQVGKPDDEEGIGVARYVIGGLVGTGTGLGLGHAISGEYTSTGYIFTLGELGSLMLAGGVQNESLQVGAVAAFLGLRVWEVYDIWTRPRLERSDEAKRPDATWIAAPTLERDKLGFSIYGRF